jgi:mannose-6-phosphate isomerase-like protein (cupin superfamily)
MHKLNNDDKEENYFVVEGCVEIQIEEDKEDIKNGEDEDGLK